TFEDIAGAGREHVALGLAMAVACFSLIGLPLTVGFFGKLYLIRPALHASQDAAVRTRMIWLVVITMVNAAISAAYYLRIVATMLLRFEPEARAGEPASAGGSTPIRSIPVSIAIGLSIAGTILFGAVFPATELLDTRAESAATFDTSIAPSVS